MIFDENMQYGIGKISSKAITLYFKTPNLEFISILVLHIK